MLYDLTGSRKSKVASFKLNICKSGRVPFTHLLVRLYSLSWGHKEGHRKSVGVPLIKVLNPANWLLYSKKWLIDFIDPTLVMPVKKTWFRTGFDDLVIRGKSLGDRRTNRRHRDGVCEIYIAQHRTSHGAPSVVATVNVGGDEHGHVIGPRNVAELGPVAGHHKVHVEAENEGDRNQSVAYLAVLDDHLEYPQHTKERDG